MTQSSKILIAGATGTVGRELAAQLSERVPRCAHWCVTPSRPTPSRRGARAWRPDRPLKSQRSSQRDREDVLRMAVHL